MDFTHTYFLDFKQYAKFSSLIYDYLNQKDSLRKFYSNFPTAENLYKQTQIKLAQYDHRAVVNEAFQKQLTNLELTPKQKENFQKFKLSNTVTVTTGHQLNLFTGPLYFFYKILQTIRCCEELSKRYPEFNFVPVFWMATEDHDFAEINHFYTQTQKISWHKETQGPVGKLDLENIEHTLQTFLNSLPESQRKHQIQSLIENSYFKSRNLTEATQKLVQMLFGEMGLLIIDGDDSQLKKLMIPTFVDEIKNQTSFDKVSEANRELEYLGYSIQVNPREINLFYIGNGEIRERIVKKDQFYEVLNTNLKFTETEIIEEIQNHPEKFSPNALLRPFYQELILPNIAYIGGSGEIAYWLQLKNYFDQRQVAFPILIVRNSVLILTSKQHQKLEKLNIQLQELFQPLYKLIADNVMKNSELEDHLKNYETKLNLMFDQLENQAYKTDKSFLDMVQAQRAKQIKGLKKLQKRLVKAEKRKQHERVEHIEMIYSELFPLGNLQERFVNFSDLWIEHGPEFIDEIYQDIQPWDFQFMIKILP